MPNHRTMRQSLELLPCSNRQVLQTSAFFHSMMRRRVFPPEDTHPPSSAKKLSTSASMAAGSSSKPSNKQPFSFSRRQQLPQSRTSLPPRSAVSAGSQALHRPVNAKATQTGRKVTLGENYAGISSKAELVSRARRIGMSWRDYDFRTAGKLLAGQLLAVEHGMTATR
jgi:hypothetical protein